MTEAKMRIQRVIQMAGLASRRMADEWIEQGRVRVNGETATVGQSVDPSVDQIVVDGKPLPEKREFLYWMVNKPAGYTCSLKDRHAQHLVTELIPQDQGRLYPIGRLDRDSEGLLLMTNDGNLAFKLSHPRFQVEKIYEVWVKGVPRAHRLDRIARGIQLEDGLAKPSSVNLIRSESGTALLRMVLTEGKKREIRRLMDKVGHPVVRLTRVAYAHLSITGLEPGQARPLTHREMVELQQLVGSGSPSPQALPDERKFRRTRSATDHGQRSSTTGSQQSRRGVAVSTRPSRRPVRQSRGDRGRAHR